MNNNTHMARCIEKITVSKQRGYDSRTDDLTVHVQLRRAAVLGVSVSTTEWASSGMDATQARYAAEARRRQIARSLADCFTREIEDAVARLDNAALVGEEFSLRSAC